MSKYMNQIRGLLHHKEILVQNVMIGSGCVVGVWFFGWNCLQFYKKDIAPEPPFMNKPELVDVKPLSERITESTKKERKLTLVNMSM